MASKRIQYVGPRGGIRYMTVAESEKQREFDRKQEIARKRAATIERKAREREAEWAAKQTKETTIEGQTWHHINIENMGSGERNQVYRDLLRMTRSGKTYGISFTVTRPNGSYRMDTSNERMFSQNKAIDSRTNLSTFYGWVDAYEDDDWVVEEVSWKELD